MSNHLISEVYRRQVGNMARNAVLVLLADKASDDGSGIWASKQRMADEIGASKQTVIATLKALADDGLISEAGRRKCANGYTIEYAINVKALRALPLVKSHASDQSEDLTGQIPLPVKMADPTSQIPLPDQSEDLTQTLLNPPKPKRRRSKSKADDQVEKPGDVSDQVWGDFLKHRRQKRASVSETVIAGIRREAVKAGWSLNDALAESITRGWQGFQAKWVQDDMVRAGQSTAGRGEFLQHLLSSGAVGEGR